jgi:chromosome segregation ATPase
MSVLGKQTGSRASRIAWGLLALLLAGGLLLSFQVAGRALTDEKRAAEQRAEFLTNTVLFNALSPEVVSDVIFGPGYRSLIITVQGKILADSAVGPDAIAQVRIWRPDGTLIFSTAQRDKIGEFVARGNPQIEQALNGRTVSLLTEAQVAPKAGLQGSQERLYETFVPLHLPNQIGVLAAVQIDTRYAAITSAANRVWRPVQLGLLAGLIVALLLFVMSLRTAPEAVPAEGAPVADLAEADRRVHLAERAVVQAAEETLKAQEVAKGYQEKLTKSEQRLRETLTAARGLEDDVKEATTRIPALEAELKRLQDLSAARDEPSKAEVEAKTEVERLAAALKESELERDRSTQEVRRVLESVTALEANLAEARASTASGEAGSAKTAEQIRAAEERAAALEAEVAKVTTQLASAETARSAHEAEDIQAAAEARKVMDSKDKKAATELSKAQLNLQEATAKLAEVQQLTQTSEAKHGRVSTDLQLVRKSLLEREAELKKLRDESAARDADLQTAAVKVADLQTAAAKVAKLEAAAAKFSELEPKAAKVSELEARIRELEEARRKEVVEVQTAQERLANSQAELIATTKRAKESEEKLKSALTATAEAEAATAAREPRAFEEPSFEPIATLAGRLSRLARKPEDVPSEEQEPATADASPAEPATEEAAAAEEAGSEAESLRSRLARAAAARHRPPSTPPGSSS